MANFVVVVLTLAWNNLFLTKQCYLQDNHTRVASGRVLLESNPAPDGAHELDRPAHTAMRHHATERARAYLTAVGDVHFGTVEAAAGASKPRT